MDKKEYLKEMGINLDEIIKSNNGDVQLATKIYGSKIVKALEIAWNTRTFEIKMYWQRAAYYWAFMVSIFIAYFHVLKSSNLFVHHSFALFFVILVGCFFSSAWVSTNISSKFWQENWEHHINFLESDISGNIHETVLYKKGNDFHPSISKINLSASYVILAIWIILLAHNLFWKYIQKLPIIDFALKHALAGKIMILAVFGIFVYFIFCKKTEDDGVYKL